MMKKILIIIIAVLLLTGCGKGGTDKHSGNEGENANQKLTIVATLFPQYDFARQVAGEYADVILLLPPGIESHSYDPTPADMITIRESDMFIYTGQYMENWAQTIIDSLDESVVVLDVSQGIELVKEEDYYVGEHSHEEGGHEAGGHEAGVHEEGDHEAGVHEEDDHEAWESVSGHHHEYDPHIWTNPVYAKIMVGNIVNSLCSVDPAHAEEYRERGRNYTAELDELDAAFREVAVNARSKNIFFGGRFAMTYFIREYGFDCVSAFDDCSAESEPSIADVLKLIDEIGEQEATAIYYEELVDPKVARTIAEETGAELILLHSAHNVSKSDFDSEITYLDIMWQNVDNLKEGLY